ncbi:MAG: DUF1320 domain-containing protein [Alphaproteobacteria bacterium]|jgi:phage gp36-like protein|nr:DUF1320 domain-containing protein [Alphaproteobacteria bacterium]
MTYATHDDLLRLASRERLIELTDRSDPPAGDVDWALAQADALIDARLGVRYALPLDPVPAVLTRLAAVIAYHDLHVEAVPDKVAEDYARALAWLDRVAAGDAPLPGGGSGGGEEPAGRSGGVRAEGPARIFDRSSLKGY